MRKIPLLLTFLFIYLATAAQTKHTVKALVMDSTNRQPLEFATVAALNIRDSSLISYTITDKNGQFTLRNLRDDVPMRLLISNVGFQSLRVKLSFGKAEVLDLGNMYLSAKMLNAVIIKGERVPVIIKKDTIEFNAEAFKVRPNAVVEDLLKKLPGLQVDHDGKITVNGKNVSKIKVDGRDFFANDPKIASRNLEADMIGKVQVYDDRENDPDHILPDYKVNKIINLKFKKALKKSTFGRVVAAGGTQERYQANLMFNRFVDDLQLSVIGNSNNLSGTGISSELPTFLLGNSGGTRKETTGAANYNENWGKKVKANLTYTFSNNVTDNLSNYNRQQFLHDTTLTGNTANNNHSATSAHGINGTIEWAVDSVSKVKYAPILQYNYNDANSSSEGFAYNNFVPLLNKSSNASKASGSGTLYQHNLNYYRTFKKKGTSLNITNDIVVNPARGTDLTANDLVSYSAGLNSDTLRRIADRSSANTSVGLSAAYRYPLSKKISGSFTATGNYNRNGNNLFTFDQDPATGLYKIFLQSQSLNLIRNKWQQTLNPAINYRYKQINIDAGLNLQLLQINNQFNNNTADLNQRFTYLFPYISIGLGKFTMNYNNDVQQPDITDLQPVTIVYNQLSSFTGNPDLKPTRRHNFGLNYFNFDMMSMTSTSFNARFVIEDNSITRERFVTAQGVERTMPINRNGRFSVYFGGNIGKRFKKQSKWQFRENTNFNGSAGHNFFQVNNQDGYQDTYAITLNQEISVDYNDILDVSPSYSINPSFTKYQIVNYNNFSYVTQRLNVPVDLHWPNKMNWVMNYSYIYNPLVAPGFQRRTNLLSLSVARALLQKDKGEIRLTCYDLFNQSVSAYHYATENTIIDNQNQAIKRYFLLTYTYRFNKTITK